MDHWSKLVKLLLKETKLAEASCGMKIQNHPMTDQDVQAKVMRFHAHQEVDRVVMLRYGTFVWIVKSLLSF